MSGFVRPFRKDEVRRGRQGKGGMGCDVMGTYGCSGQIAQRREPHEENIRPAKGFAVGLRCPMGMSMSMPMGREQSLFARSGMVGDLARAGLSPPGESECVEDRNEACECERGETGQVASEQRLEVVCGRSEKRKE